MSDAEAVTTVESRARGITAGRLTTAAAAISAYLAAQQIANSDITEVLSRPPVHAAILKILTALRDAVIAAITAAYRASARIAHRSLSGQLAEHGHTAELDLDDLGGYLDAVLTDVRTAITNTPLDLADILRNTITATTDEQHRAALITAAVDRSIRRLGVHLNAAAATAAHRGHTDATTQILRAIQQATPGTQLYKTWTTRSAAPCPACAALDGTTIAVDEEFDAGATAQNNWTPPRVYRDLQGPPRHPNCRCKLVYSASPATTAYRRTATATPLGPRVSTLSATDIRRMPSDTYQRLTRFLSGAIRRLRALLARIRRGK